MSGEEFDQSVDGAFWGDAAGLPMAVISDVHANLSALRVVLADIESRGIGNIVCLGDIVGYGPDPVECWRVISGVCRTIVRGNHDQALGKGSLDRFHPRAAAALEWTKRRILAEPDGERILESLVNLPRTAREGEFLFVHGSPRGPTMDYLLPGDSFDVKRMEGEFSHIGGGAVYAFNGHTHIPGVVVRGMRFLPPEVLDRSRYQLVGRQAIVNAGSVGQPRDGNPRASYVTVEGGAVHFHRLDYDAEAVCRRILATDGLDPFLGQRLLAGY